MVQECHVPHPSKSLKYLVSWLVKNPKVADTLESGGAESWNSEPSRVDACAGSHCSSAWGFPAKVPSLSEKLAAKILVDSPESKSDHERGTRVLRADGVTRCNKMQQMQETLVHSTPRQLLAENSHSVGLQQVVQLIEHEGVEVAAKAALPVAWCLFEFVFSGCHLFWSDWEPLRVGCKTGTLWKWQARTEPQEQFREDVGGCQH